MTSRLRALVVDDSTTLQRLMELTLSPLGIDIDFAISGEQALHAITKRSYNIIFLDVILPGMDGYKVCKTIKGNQETRATPIVMLTSRDSAYDKVRGAMAGTDLYLTKPLDRTKLLAAIKKYLPLDSARATG